MSEPATRHGRGEATEYNERCAASVARETRPGEASKMEPSTLDPATTLIVPSRVAPRNISQFPSSQCFKSIDVHKQPVSVYGEGVNLGCEDGFVTSMLENIRPKIKWKRQTPTCHRRSTAV
uniref:Uncharacterized protein n=1 Tax=Graphocephala atropunctata TaxID=36148 RepID=A0A1B6KBS9_9HEMI